MVPILVAMLITVSLADRSIGSDVKIENIVFGDNLSQSQTRKVTLPTNAIIKGISVNNGMVTYHRNGGVLEVLVSNGEKNSQIYDSSLYSKKIDDFVTKGTNAFSSSLSYSQNGYDGTLYKDGNAYVYSGSYTPYDEKWVTGQYSTNYDVGGYSGLLSQYVYSGSYVSRDVKVESDTRSTSPGGSTSSLPSSISYNSGGYSGTLSKSGSVQLISGTYTASTSKWVETGPESGWSEYSYMCERVSGKLVWVSKYVSDRSDIGTTRNYNQDGYSGTLSRDESRAKWGAPSLSGNSCSNLNSTTKKRETHTGIYFNGTVVKPATDTRIYRQNYSGTVIRPESDTRVYRYQGMVYRPASDTRIYRQNYTGTVYKGGWIPAYSYVVDISYVIDDIAPTIDSSHIPTVWTNEFVTIDLKGGTDRGGGEFSHIVLPNGVLVYGNHASYTVYQNDVYHFSIYDSVNNSRGIDYEIRNIDKKLPEISINGNPLENGNLSLNIKIIDK